VYGLFAHPKRKRNPLPRPTLFTRPIDLQLFERLQQPAQGGHSRKPDRRITTRGTSRELSCFLLHVVNLH
jgi:hypothetical protein